MTKNTEREIYNKLLTEKCNEIKEKLEEMDEREREEYVSKVVDWIVKMFEDIRNAMEEGGVVKAGKVAMKYKKQLEDIETKATAIVCLTYCIKPQYQEKLAPIFTGVLGLV